MLQREQERYLQNVIDTKEGYRCTCSSQDEMKGLIQSLLLRFIKSVATVEKVSDRHLGGIEIANRASGTITNAALEGLYKEIICLLSLYSRISQMTMPRYLTGQSGFIFLIVLR